MSNSATAELKPAENFGLPVAATAAMQRVFAQHPGIRQAIVYGSRAKGNYRPGSDIDLTLDAPTLAFAEFLQIDEALDDLMLPYRIDLSMVGQIDDPDLRSHIARVGKVLWQNPHPVN